MKAFKCFAVAALLFATQAQAQNGGGVVGGLIGGALGSKFGHGNGQVASAVVGALAGQYVGQRVSEQPRQSSYQNQNYDTTYHQPVRQQRVVVSQSQPVQRDVYQRDAYTRSAADDYYSYEQDRRQVRQQRQRRYERYNYTVVTEAGRRINMVGCAAYDERENAWRQTDLRQCDGYDD